LLLSVVICAASSWHARDQLHLRQSSDEEDDEPLVKPAGNGVKAEAKSPVKAEKRRSSSDSDEDAPIQAKKTKTEPVKSEDDDDDDDDE